MRHKLCLQHVFQAGLGKAALHKCTSISWHPGCTLKVMLVCNGPLMRMRHLVGGRVADCAALRCGSEHVFVREGQGHAPSIVVCNNRSDVKGQSRLRS